jgi:hypothetical protein
VGEQQEQAEAEQRAGDRGRGADMSRITRNVAAQTISPTAEMESVWWYGKPQSSPEWA